MLLMPIAPSAAVTRTTTHLVTFLETPPLVNVPTSGMPMQNTSILLIVAIIPELFRCLLQDSNILKLHREERQGREGKLKALPRRTRRTQRGGFNTQTPSPFAMFFMDRINRIDRIKANQSSGSFLLSSVG